MESGMFLWLTGNVSLDDLIEFDAEAISDDRWRGDRCRPRGLQQFEQQNGEDDHDTGNDDWYYGVDHRVILHGWDATTRE